MEKTVDNTAEARRAYQREWRAKNREKVRAYNESYWKKRAERAKEARNDANEQRTGT